MYAENNTGRWTEAKHLFRLCSDFFGAARCVSIRLHCIKPTKGAEAIALPLPQPAFGVRRDPCTMQKERVRKGGSLERGVQAGDPPGRPCKKDLCVGHVHIRDGFRSQLQLHGVQAGVDSAEGEEFLVGALLADTCIGQDEDATGIANGREPVGDNDHGAALPQCL